MSLAADLRGVTVRVPGKINLELVVGPLREDGYHEVATVYHAVGIHDHVTVVPAADWSGGPTRTGCPSAGTTWRSGRPGGWPGSPG